MPVNSVIALPSPSILSPPWMPSSPNHVPLNRLCWCCFIKSYPLNQMPCLRIWLCGFVYKRYLVNADRWLQPAFPFLLFLLVSVYLSHTLNIDHRVWEPWKFLKLQFSHSPVSVYYCRQFCSFSFYISLSRCITVDDFPISVLYCGIALRILLLGYTELGFEYFLFFLKQLR